ncbi:MAG: biotin--[acetyl-CoA-carboxylase] ligase [Clostridiales bacterium]|nr:biotin--[acetyl-CoA-carboxylase] ligase [Clostridiales bacterium]
MIVKEELVKLFETSRERYISGNEMAEIFGVSRTAVWKMINSLRNEGYEIEAAGSKGYRLLPENDVISASGIEKYLDSSEGKFRFCIYDSVASTNDVLKEKANSGEAEGLVAAASSQTGGKGRMGRIFFSPEGTGVYFSMLLRPQIPLEEMTLITTAAAVAVCRAVERISDIKAEIKWVNDVYVKGRKAAGILTEASFGGETGTLDYVILGIGMNLYGPKGDFPEDIADSAGSFFDIRIEDGRNKAIAFVLEEFYKIYEDFHDKGFVKEYIKRSFVIGKQVMVTSIGKEPYFAEVLGIDPVCRLEVMREDGSVEFLNSGEISIRTRDLKRGKYE